MDTILDPVVIGQRLRGLREKKGATLVKAAEDLGITPSALSRYETGERIPRDEVKVKMAEYYKRSVAFIFFNSKVDETQTKSGD